MKACLGIDTSNYTTSCALFFPENGKVKSCKKLLPVKSGERGIRQSDAVFHHTKQLWTLFKELMNNDYEITAVGYSAFPRLAEGSYMPCFLAGENTAQCVGTALRVNVHKTSHQCGHILSGLYSCGKIDLLKSHKPFFAFHVSGGTTDLLMCNSDCEKILDIKRIGGTTDLNAGQAVDRIGVRMGLDFPAGKELEKLALNSSTSFKIRPSVRGTDCSLSGLENKCNDMLKKGVSKEDIAEFTFEYIAVTVEKTVENALEIYGSMPVVFVGGVISNSIIRKYLCDRFECYFAGPEFSCDNAVGTAVFSALKEGLI